MYFFLRFKSYYFGYYGPHGKFQNHTFSRSGLSNLKFTPKYSIAWAEWGIIQDLRFQSYSFGNYGSHAIFEYFSILGKQVTKLAHIFVFSLPEWFWKKIAPNHLIFFMVQWITLPSVARIFLDSEAIFFKILLFWEERS